jgi:hypothetical protein
MEAIDKFGKNTLAGSPVIFSRVPEGVEVTIKLPYLAYKMLMQKLSVPTEIKSKTQETQ